MPHVIHMAFHIKASFQNTCRTSSFPLFVAKAVWIAESKILTHNNQLFELEGILNDVRWVDNHLISSLLERQLRQAYFIFNI